MIAKKEGNKWIIIILAIVIFVISILVVFSVNRNIVSDRNSVSIINKGCDISSKSNKIKSYSIKYDLINTGESEYTISNEFSIKTKINNIDNNKVYYSFILNNSDYIYDDFIQIENVESFTICIYQIGDFFAFENTGKKSIQDTHLFIFEKSGHLYKDLYDIVCNDDNGMYIESINCNEQLFNIITCRISNDNKILYNNNHYEINKNVLEVLPNNLPIRIRYKFSIDRSGTVDFLNPEKIIIENIENFVKINT